MSDFLPGKNHAGFNPEPNEPVAHAKPKGECSHVSNGADVAATVAFASEWTELDGIMRSQELDLDLCEACAAAGGPT